MRVEDLEAVMAIEEQSFPTPWSRGAYQRELTENPYAVYLVAECQGEVAGYIGCWILIDEAHITNVAVHPQFRRLGIGGRLLGAVLTEAAVRGSRRATLEVRPSNFGAQTLYQKYGFSFHGVRKNYYTDTHEDALIMWKDDLADLPAEDDRAGR